MTDTKERQLLKHCATVTHHCIQLQLEEAALIIEQVVRNIQRHKLQSGQEGRESTVGLGLAKEWERKKQSKILTCFKVSSA